MSERATMPRQHQERQPGREAEMHPRLDYLLRFHGLGMLAEMKANVLDAPAD